MSNNGTVAVLPARVDYPIGSISSGTMRNEDLIPTFVANLYYNARVDKRNKFVHTIGDVPAKIRKQHVRLVADIEARMERDDYWESEDSDADLESLMDALQEYAGPYFYFGSHPGDGSDYGFWLSEDWDSDFVTADEWQSDLCLDQIVSDSIKVSDLSEVPDRFRGKVAVVNDHGIVSLYVRTARAFRLVWEVV